MIKYLQLPFFFDAKRLQEEIHLLESAPWKMHYQTLHYLGEWSGIPLRSADGKADDLIISTRPDSIYKNTVYLQEGSYLQQVLNSFECPLKAVRLLKLNPGAVIKEHTDAELCFEKAEIRLHIPVITDDAVEFFSGKERLHMKEGECWYVNFNLPHSINNKSSINRVHLVIDADVNEWVKSLFYTDGILPKKEMEEPDPYDDAAKIEMIRRFRDMNTPRAHELADALQKKLNTP